MTPREIEHALTIAALHMCEHQHGECPMVNYLQGHTFRAVQAVQSEGGNAIGLLLVLDEGGPKVDTQECVQVGAGLLAEILRLASELQAPPMDPRKN